MTTTTEASTDRWSAAVRRIMQSQAEPTDSTFYVEQLGSRHFTTGIAVGISREATLSEDLSQIESRELRGIRLATGYEGDDTVVTLSREAAEWLRDRLTEALVRTDEFADGNRIEATA